MADNLFSGFSQAEIPFQAGDEIGQDQSSTAGYAPFFTKAKGPFFVDDRDNVVLDASSASWLSLLGPAHPVIVRALLNQAREMTFISGKGATHPRIGSLGNTILKLFPGNHTHLYFCTTEKKAIAQAMEWAMQLRKTEEPRKNKCLILSGQSKPFFNSISELVNAPLNEKNAKLEWIHLPLPNGKNARQVFNTTEKYVRRGDVLALIYQPLLLNGDAWRFYDRNLLDKLLLMCRQLGVITIADECYTGFCRTGDLFASQGQLYPPDIACLLPGFANQLPLAMVSCIQSIGDSLGLNHIATDVYGTPGPLAFAVAEAGIQALQSTEIHQGLQITGAMQSQFAKRMSSHPTLSGIYASGTLLWMECKNPNPETAPKLTTSGIREHFAERGILLHTWPNGMLMSLPFSTGSAWIKKVQNEIKEFLDLHRQINLF
jgi:adenosylmethionine-8-amino-7-oxononanoate aminotransferase